MVRDPSPARVPPATVVFRLFRVMRSSARSTAAVRFSIAGKRPSLKRRPPPARLISPFSSGFPIFPLATTLPVRNPVTCSAAGTSVVNRERSSRGRSMRASMGSSANNFGSFAHSEGRNGSVAFIVAAGKSGAVAVASATIFPSLPLRVTFRSAGGRLGLAGERRSLASNMASTTGSA